MTEQSNQQASKTLWAGRYEQETAASLRKLNDSYPFDKRMYRDDIACSRGYARALERAGILTADEQSAIDSGLNRVLAEFETNTFTVAPGDEDIHTAVERRLTELIGAPAGKLHTGRSRNDQVATDFRHWTMRTVRDLQVLIRDLIGVITDQAERHADTLMPGYTHLRAAQPITTGHWLLSTAWMLIRDLTRWDSVHESASVCPLGSSALAGTPYPIDRSALAHDLGFKTVSANSLDAVADRDFAAEFLFAASLTMTHLSRFAEDVILYSSPQFGFIALDERFTTGSSLMPQKQNPDIFELARGKQGRITGHLSGLLTTLKGLPSAYNKDLQEDKEPVFDTADTLAALLPALIGAVDSMQFNPDRMRAALDEGMLATDIADYLVHKGIPFREAHGIVGRLVRAGLDADLPLSRLPFDTYRAIHPIFEQDVFEVFDFARAVAKRGNVGGTAPESVRDQVRQIRGLKGASDKYGSVGSAGG